MDTEQKYVDGADFYVQMAGEGPPAFVRERKEARIADPDDPLVSYNKSQIDHHQLNENVPVSGYVHFYFPDRLDDPHPAGVWSFSFPFRDHREDGQWFALPDEDKWHRHPVWKWTNPEGDPHENLTLNPSLGVGGGEGPIVFHCFIEEGEVRWV